jgi:hypothetical protein
MIDSVADVAGGGVQPQLRLTQLVQVRAYASTFMILDKLAGRRIAEIQSNFRM